MSAGAPGRDAGVRHESGPEMTTPMLTVRELGPHDGAVLDTVFAGLSTLSRFRRFHGAMPRMPSSARSQARSPSASRG